jgi:hypothetical protein
MPIFNIQFGRNICYRRINPTKLAASDASSDSHADVRNLDIGQSYELIDQVVSTFRAVEMSVYCCLLQL